MAAWTPRASPSMASRMRSQCRASMCASSASPRASSSGAWAWRLRMPPMSTPRAAMPRKRRRASSHAKPDLIPLQPEPLMLHPQAKAFIELLIEKGVPPTHTLSHTDARMFYRERRALTQPPPGEVAEVRDLSAEGPHGAIPLRSYRPLGSDAAAALPVLVYYHGGGWTIGDLDTHDTLCRELCNLSGCAVVAVDYRMGPEHRFPAAVDDVIAATRWVRQQAGALKIDAN